MNTSTWKGASIFLFAALLLFLGIYFYEDVYTSFNFWGMIALAVESSITIIASAISILFAIALVKYLPWYFLFIAGFSYITLYLILPEFPWPGSTAALLFILVLPAIFGACLSLLLQKNSFVMKTGAFLGVLASTIGLTAGGYWLANNGSSDVLQNEMIPSEDPKSSKNPAAEGPYKVQTITYGSGKDLHRPEYGEDAALITNSVDGSPYVNKWEGFSGWLRTKYWGFNPEEFPLNGRVWHPEGRGPFPLVLIVHGNHEMGEFSDTGYAYLGNLFASKGFITVSVDENFLNDSWMDLWLNLHEPIARGWILLEHLKLWRTWNEQSGNPFYEKVDMNKIALIGHSRGGEAIITAAVFNDLPYYPQDATISFDYKFQIQALAAIAPVDGQAKLGAYKPALKDMNYFVMHGANDGDVRSFAGKLQYDRMEFTGSKYHFKSSLYIYGANHTQFNESWGPNDVEWPESMLLDKSNIISGAAQRQIAKVYLASFLEASLHDRMEYIALFQDYRTGHEWLPQTLYLNQFEDSNSRYIISGDEGVDITATEINGINIHTSNLVDWNITNVRLKNGKIQKNAQLIAWNSDSTGIYEIDIPPGSFPLQDNEIFFMTIAEEIPIDDEETSDAPPSNPKTPLNFTIELMDKEGRSAKVPFTSSSSIHAPSPIHLFKSSIFDDSPSTEPIFQTANIPLQTFLKTTSALDLSNITKIRFIFDQTKSDSFLLGNLGFRTPI